MTTRSASSTRARSVRSRWRGTTLHLVLCGLALVAAPAHSETVQHGSADLSYVLMAPENGRATLRSPAGRLVALPESGSAPRWSDLLADGRAAILAGSTVETGGFRRLQVYRWNGRTWRAIAPPAPPLRGDQTSPTLLGEQPSLEGQQRLRGLAWLEGDDPRKHAVMWAPFEEQRFGTPLVISAPGPGSQVGLTGATLTDGTQLLVWSAVDGHDDEVVFSWHERGEWTTPRSFYADNDVPDIVPAIGATDDGAWVAWSRFIEGHYRLLLLWFRNGRWDPPATIGGPGTLYPQFVQQDGRALVSFYDAAAAQWIARELAHDGPTDRTVSTRAADRPLIERFDDRSVVQRETNDLRRPAQSLLWSEVGVPAAEPVSRRSATSPSAVRRVPPDDSKTRRPPEKQPTPPLALHNPRPDQRR